MTRTREGAIAAGVFALYVVLRVWTFTQSDNGIDFHHNAYDRGLFVAEWVTSERIVPDITYGPASFYLIAATMAFVPDPTLAARVLAFVSSIALFIVVWLVTRRLWGAGAAIAATLLLAFHPHGIRLSVVGLEMMPYAFFLVAGFAALARFETRDGRAFDALAAGLLFTLAAATRFDGWIVLPIAGVFALVRRVSTGLVFNACAAAFPVAWLAYNYDYSGRPFHFLAVAGRVAEVHMGDLSVAERIVQWPVILARYAPLPTLLLGLAAIGLAWRSRAARPLLFAWIATILVFMARTAGGSMGTNETKYVMPVVVMMIPQAGRALERLARGSRGGRIAAAATLTLVAVWSLSVTVKDNRRFAAARGLAEQAAFLSGIDEGRVMIGTSDKGYLQVEAKLGGERAIGADISDATGRLDGDQVHRRLSEGGPIYLAYQYGSPIDFAPLMRLPEQARLATWRGIAFERVFWSSDKKYAVYKVEPGGGLADSGAVAPAGDGVGAAKDSGAADNTGGADDG
ncbi:glycosyltransferase family 39 protein [bacterium]|nr:glycosyltransferase family 39 protein [bacterium]